MSGSAIRRTAIILLYLAFILILSGISLAAEKVFFVTTDPAGSPVAMRDAATGSVVWRADYKPFGQEQSVSGSVENNTRFIGKEKDKETGLDYFGGRYMYDKPGRFISPDPVGPVDPWTGKINMEVLLNPQRLNAYAYGLNNPYRYTDPLGLWTVSIGVDLSGYLGAFGGGGGTAVNLGYSEKKGLSFSLTGTAGGGAVAGVGASLGVSIVKTDASSVNQLLGTFVEGSRGLGPRTTIIGVAGEGVTGEGVIIGLAGKGGPPQAGGMATTTSAIIQYDQGNLSVGNSGNGSIWSSESYRGATQNPSGARNEPIKKNTTTDE